MRFAKELPAKYFRYVDDITLVGEANAVKQSLGIVREGLQDLGFELHNCESPKHLELPVKEWLKGRDDFRPNSGATPWQKLIGDLNRFLFLRPELRQDLQGAFREAGIRIPIRDYSCAIYEKSYIGRLLELAQNAWFRRKSHAVTIGTLLHDASALRRGYQMEFLKKVECTGQLTGYERKRTVPKLRYWAGRLVYIATDEVLLSLSQALGGLPELHLHSEVMKAVATGNVGQVLGLGTNAAQAAAQPLRAAGRTCTTSIANPTQTEELSLAVFALNGVSMAPAETPPRSGSELLQFATLGATKALMRSADPFIREIACLHGIAKDPRHPDLLNLVFDMDESLTMDAIDQLQPYMSP